jgi:hypothetical protein
VNHESHKSIYLNTNNYMSFNWKRTMILVLQWSCLSQHRFSVNVQARGSNFLSLWKTQAWLPTRLRGAAGCRLPRITFQTWTRGPPFLEMAPPDLWTLWALSPPRATSFWAGMVASCGRTSLLFHSHMTSVSTSAKTQEIGLINVI